MKEIYKKYSGGGEGPDDSDLVAAIYDDGSLVLQTNLRDELLPFLAERHVLEFIDALRRAYADRYDIVKKTARRSAIKGTSDD